MAELLLVDDAVWVWSHPTGIHIYDFDFRSSLPCRLPWERPDEVVAVSRCGAFDDYAAQYDQLRNDGIRLVHTPEQHRRASELSQWYPLIDNMTPRSIVYERTPLGSQVADEFRFPVFVKGSRQTSRHQKALAIIESPNDFDDVMSQYATDPILRWQTVVVRELVSLRHIESVVRDRIPSSFEFRTFWWNGRCVGAGRYWWEGRRYEWTDDERLDALSVAEEAARRVDVLFLVVDMAMTEQGEWIVIECNDGQESGYAGVSPIGLWQAIIDIERTKDQ